jgi:hypothetical protein
MKLFTASSPANQSAQISEICGFVRKSRRDTQDTSPCRRSCQLFLVPEAGSDKNGWRFSHAPEDRQKIDLAHPVQPGHATRNAKRPLIVKGQITKTRKSPLFAEISVPRSLIAILAVTGDNE